MSLIKIAERTTETSARQNVFEEQPNWMIEGTSIGDILIQAGRLTHQELDRIIALQGKENILFGEAAVSLGILKEDDVRWALSSQYSYPNANSEETMLAADLVMIHEPFSRMAEAFRSIRSGLMLSGIGKLIKSIAVVSPGAGEGKSFIAANLATGFAQLGSRALLVDFNFRSPRQHALFKVKNNTGASSLIIKRALYEDALQKTALSSLDILTSGPKPPNPLELLSWPNTAELLGNLGKRYEILIVDTPAFVPTADSMVIAGMCDAALLVAQKGKTKNLHFGQTKRQLDAAGIKILGSVVNEPRG